MDCFGCSREVSNKNLSHNIEELDLVKTGSLTKNKKKNPWILSWSILRSKKSAAKTVPVDISMSGNLDPITKSHSVKLDKKINTGSSKKHRHLIGVNAINSAYKKKLGNVKEIILESCEIEHLNSIAKEDKHDKKLSTRKKETNKTRSSKSSSPPEKTNPIVTNRVDSATPPPHRRKKPKLSTHENGNDDVNHVKKESKQALDSIIGMSIIIVILVLILFLDKLYAILCTSACFYMIPRLRTAVDSNVIVNNGLDSDAPDLNSDEYKKKVVLEGFLQRNRRNVIQIL